MSVRSGDAQNTDNRPGRSLGQHAPRGTLALLDDDDTWRDAATHLLRREGYVVVAVRDVAGLVEALSRHSVDAIVADSRVPDGDGWREAVRLADAHGGLPVVIVSGYDEDAILLTGGTVPGRYVRKEGGAAALLAAIQAVVRPPPER
jgi:DNA-binding response OmpR family regulator